MHRITADSKQNRLYIELTGVIDKDEAEKILMEIIVAASSLKPGFDVINDMRKMKLGHLSAVGTLHNVIEFLQNKSVGKIIRVVGASKMVFMQFVRATQGFRGYKPIYAKTLEDAEKILKKK